MVKATSFAPGHISGFFEPVYTKHDLERSGSRGAGINITLGAISEVEANSSTKQDIQIFINNKKSNANVTNLTLKYLIGTKPIDIIVKTNLQLPSGQGFGMSAASALSAALSLARMLGYSNTDAMKAAHCAEIQLKTGLSDVLASCFGGIEIRKEAGLPPWGLIEHIPGKYELVLCIIGKKIDTKKILYNSQKANKIMNYGKYCTKKILEKPSIENLFSLSQTFTKKTELADKQVLKAINSANNYGMASMCMLGNSVFAIGKTNNLCKALSPFGKIFICSVDEYGARVID
jgi:pantoate kinase